MTFSWRSLIVLSGLSIAPLVAHGTETLSLNAFLQRVESENPELRSLSAAMVATDQKVLELDMVYSPYLTGTYAYTDDRSGSGFGSTLPTARMTGSNWNLTAAKKFAFGSTVSLGMSSLDATFDLAQPTQVFGPTSVNSFTGYDMKPFARIEQSLLRDFRSGLTLSGIRKAKAGARAARYGQLFRKQQILLNAKAAYWGLSLAREVAQFRAASLARTEKLLRWNERRVAMDLAERSDLLQTQAAYTLRQLNLAQAEDDVVRACRDLNQLLGSDASDVCFPLERIPAVSTAGALPVRAGERADVLSARAQFDSSEMAKKETYYRSLPELSVSGLYSLRGLSLTASDAWDQITAADKPTYAVGLSFTVPLDYVTLRKVRAGYDKDYAAARDALAQAELASRNDWEQLLRSLTNVRERLALAREVRDIQERRIADEQRRFERGRTTTFQVLQAETDLDDATLTVLRLRYEELMTLAQADLFSISE